MPLKPAKGQSVVASGELRSAQEGESSIARTSITEDASTHPLAERLKEDAFPYSGESSRSGYPRGKDGEQ
jgi:hypothetical protein